jgi:hypothetical protein
MKLHTLKQLRDGLKALLLGEASTVCALEAPNAMLDDLLIFTPAIPHKARHGAILLAFEAACAAAEQASMQAHQTD